MCSLKLARRDLFSKSESDTTGRTAVFAVIAGGGTAGHVMPAIAVAEALVEAGHPRSSLIFMGVKRGMEAEIVPKAGFRVILTAGRGLVTSSAFSKLLRGLVLAVSTLRAFITLGCNKPKVAVSTGGYACIPGSVAALLWRIPLVVVNVDTTPGMANKILTRFATCSAVTFPDTPLPRAVLTGTPLRKSITSCVRSSQTTQAARLELGLPLDRSVVAVLGGSLGARRINEAIFDMVGFCAERTNLAVYHVMGQRDWVYFKDLLPQFSGLSQSFGSAIFYKAVPYEERMPELLMSCDLIIGRAGASFIAEIMACGVPSILVPLPSSPGGHQSNNAYFLADHGGAIVLEDGLCTGKNLAKLLMDLLNHPDRLRKMSQSVASLGQKDAANKVVNLVERAANQY